MNEISPPHVHWHFDAIVSGWMPSSCNAVAPPVQGWVTGTHGCGAPSIAATSGLDELVHNPNGGMFAIGSKCITVAIALPCAVAAPGVAARVAGIVPSLQRI